MKKTGSLKEPETQKFGMETALESKTKTRNLKGLESLLETGQREKMETKNGKYGKNSKNGIWGNRKKEAGKNELKKKSVKRKASKKAERQKRKRANVFTTFVKLFPMVFKTSPVLFIIPEVTIILFSLSMGMNTIIMQKFFDSASEMINGKAGISDVIYSLLAFGLINVISQVMNGLGNFLIQVFGLKAEGKLSFKINEKMGRMSPICFEDTRMLDDIINKAENGKSNAVWFVLQFNTIFTFYFPYFIFMSFYLYSLKPGLVVSIVLVFITKDVLWDGSILRKPGFSGLIIILLSFLRNLLYC